MTQFTKKYEVGETALVEAVALKLLNRWPKTSGGDQPPLEFLDICGHIIFLSDHILRAPEYRLISIWYYESCSQRMLHSISRDQHLQWSEKFPKFTRQMLQYVKDHFAPSSLNRQAQKLILTNQLFLTAFEFGDDLLHAINELSLRGDLKDPEILFASIERGLRKSSMVLPDIGRDNLRRFIGGFFEEGDLMPMPWEISAHLLQNSLPEHKNIGADVLRKADSRLRTQYKKILAMRECVGITLDGITRGGEALNLSS